MKKYLMIAWILLSCGLSLAQSVEEQYQAADAELNRVYKELRSKLNEQQKAELKKSQLDWIKKRDASANNNPGQRQAALYKSTVQRVEELKKILMHEAGAENFDETTQEGAFSSSIIEGKNDEGQRWAYEFLYQGGEPTTTLENDSTGLILYADENFVVRSTELPGTTYHIKTELFFYDVKSCRLMAVVSVPNRVFNI